MAPPTLEVSLVVQNDRVELGAFELVEALQADSERMLWRAAHSKTGASAAVKILTGPLGSDRVEALEREVRAQARLQHPGVVRLFDYGVVGERCAAALSDRIASLAESEIRPDHPYLAMEWADQGSLRHALPLGDWKEIRWVLTSILQTLAYAHARDVIHRDLKPENILVFQAGSGGTGEKRLKLGDFGLAHATGVGMEVDEEALASVSGTPGYLPPEQARGDWREFGPWTDIYSVGCLTWRLVCHQLPFTGQSAFGVILKHVDADRPLLEPKVPVPSSLEEWIHRAMAIDPRDRFQTAADALAALPTEEGTDADGQVSIPSDWRAVDSPDAALKPTRRQTQLEGLELFGLRELPVVGRRPQRDVLWSEMKRVFEQGGLRVVHVEGDAGVGKSRLAEWIHRIADEVGAAKRLRVLNSKGRPGPHEGLKGMIRRCLTCRNMERQALRERLSKRLPTLEDGEMTPEREFVEGDDHSQKIRDAMALADWLQPEASERGRIEAQPQFTSDRHRRSLLARLLRRLSADRPAVMWLDDVPWAAEALDVLEMFGADSPRTPNLLVVATGRTDEFADNPTIRHRLEELRQRHGGERIDLAPLDRTHQKRLIQAMLPLESSLEDRLIDQTEGNPLFAVQLLQHWVDQGFVQSSRRGFEVVDGWEDGLPSDLVELWEGRIERLEELSVDPSEKTVRHSLELAAAQGRSVETELWHKACDAAGLEVTHQLVDQLIARGLALESETGWEFAHGLLVESLQTRAQEGGRWTQHHKVWAGVLRDEPSRGDGRLSARRAEHLLEAGEKEAALEPLMRTARRRGLLGNMTERYEALTRRQQVLDDLGVPTDDRRRVENETHLSAHMVAEERNEEARAVASRAYQLARDNDWHLIRARTLKTLAECAKDEGDYQGSVDKLDEAIAAAERIDDHRLVSALYADRSWLSLIRGEPDRARSQLRECLAHAEAVNANYWIVNAKYQMGQVEMSAGNRKAAQSYFNEALSNARRHGLQRLEALCINSLGDFAKEDGDWEEALKCFQQFDQIADAVQISRLSLLARLNMAQVHGVRGETSKARQLIQSVSRHLAAGDITDHESLIDILRLLVAVHEGDVDRALTLFSPYEEAWPENQRLDHDVPWMLEQMVHAMQGDGEASDFTESRAQKGEASFAERLGERARQLYLRLGDESSAERLADVTAQL